MKPSRRKFLQASSLACLGLSIAHQNLFASLLSEELPYTMKPLRNNVGYFTERGGTIGWMITNNGIVIIDTQFPEQANHLIEAVKMKSDRKIDLLINTHHHGDHTGGNIAFKGLTNKLLAHENSKKNQMRVAKERNQESEQLYPDATFDKEWSGKVGDETMTLRYFGAAHTDGDAITHFENENVVHMGDLIFNRRFPYIDRSAGASIKNWIQVLQETQKLFDKDTIFIFGHAGDGYDVIGKMEDIKAKENYLSRLLEQISAAIKSGKSKEDIMKIQSIEGADEWKGGGIERNLTAAFEELSAE